MFLTCSWFKHGFIICWTWEKANDADVLKLCFKWINLCSPIFLSKQNDCICWVVIFLLVLFWRKRKSSRKCNISDDVSNFFLIKISWFMLKETYISALLVLAYLNLQFFHCSYGNILFEGFIFIWGSYSPASFNQYLFDLKIHPITCYHNKGGGGGDYRSVI